MFMTMTKTDDRPDWFAAVYQAIDGVLGCAGGGVPPGTLATLYRAIDGLRERGGCDAHVARGGAIVVTLHRLQTMLRRTEASGDVQTLRDELKAMRREWLVNTPLVH